MSLIILGIMMILSVVMIVYCDVKKHYLAGMINVGLFLIEFMTLICLLCVK